MFRMMSTSRFSSLLFFLLIPFLLAENPPNTTEHPTADVKKDVHLESSPTSTMTTPKIGSVETNPETTVQPTESGKQKRGPPKVVTTSTKKSPDPAGVVQIGTSKESIANSVPDVPLTDEVFRDRYKAQFVPHADDVSPVYIPVHPHKSKAVRLKRPPTIEEVYYYGISVPLNSLWFICGDPDQVGHSNDHYVAIKSKGNKGWSTVSVQMHGEKSTNTPDLLMSELMNTIWIAARYDNIQVIYGGLRTNFSLDSSVDKFIVYSNRNTTFIPYISKIPRKLSLDKVLEGKILGRRTLKKENTDANRMEEAPFKLYTLVSIILIMIYTACCYALVELTTGGYMPMKFYSIFGIQDFVMDGDELRTPVDENADQSMVTAIAPTGDTSRLPPEKLYSAKGWRSKNTVVHSYSSNSLGTPLQESSEARKASKGKAGTASGKPKKKSKSPKPRKTSKSHKSKKNGKSSKLKNTIKSRKSKKPLKQLKSEPSAVDGGKVASPREKLAKKSGAGATGSPNGPQKELVGTRSNIGVKSAPNGGVMKEHCPQSGGPQLVENSLVKKEQKSGNELGEKKTDQNSTTQESNTQNTLVGP